MSNLVYPVFVGWTFNVMKIPTWATRTQRSVSGRELTRGEYANPIWNFRLAYSILRDYTRPAIVMDGPTYTSELRKLMDFFNLMNGSYDTFLFEDPDDKSVIDEVIGIADGVTCCAQLGRRLYADGFLEDIIAPNVVTDVKIDDVLTEDYTLDMATGEITFPSPPANGAVITSTFSYYFRCRFMSDAAEFEKFMDLRWQLREIRLKSVIL